MQKKRSGYIVSQAFASAEGGYSFDEIKIIQHIISPPRLHGTKWTIILRRFYYDSRGQDKTISVTSLYINTYFKLQIETQM